MKLNFKKLGFWDIGLTKLSVMFSTFFLFSIWPGLRNWVIRTHWMWFLTVALLFAIKPLITVFKK